MTSDSPRRASTSRAVPGPVPVGVPTLVAWRRSGLVLCSAAVAGAIGFLALWLADDRESRDVGPAGAVLGLAVVVCALAGLGFLRRAWADPMVRDDPRVVRARRLSNVTTAAWGTALVLQSALFFWSDTTSRLPWLAAVSLVSACAAVIAFLAMLWATVQWSPLAFLGRQPDEKGPR